MFSVARLCPDQSFLSLCHRRNYAGNSMLCKVNSNSNHCMSVQLPSAFTVEFDILELRPPENGRQKSLGTTNINLTYWSHR